MKGKFWKFRTISLVLVVVLVLAVGWNLVNTLQVKNNYEVVIDTLQRELCKSKGDYEACLARMDNTALESQYWMKKYQTLSNSLYFLEDMESDIDILLNLSNSRNCCYVPPKEAQEIALRLIKMRDGFLIIQAGIKQFFEVKNED
jgi:hypothetical protein